MKSAVLDTRIATELTTLAPPAPKPQRRTPRAEMRRLPEVAKRGLRNRRLLDLCCEGRCGMENPERVAGTIARAAQEIINGARPLNMLTRWLTTDAFNALRKRLSVQARSDQPTQRTVTITSSRVCRIDHDTAEGTVILSDGGRIRAAVVRLEAFRGRWRASYVQTL